MAPRTLTSDQFFLALIAALTQRGFSTTVLTPEIDRKFEDAYTVLLRLSKKANVEPNFTFRTNKLHGVSRVLRDTIDAASRNHIISLENPSFRRMSSKLTPRAASYHLARLPLDRAYVDQIIDEALSELVPPKDDKSAA